jgi:hypothetical protein
LSSLRATMTNPPGDRSADVGARALGCTAKTVT